MAYFQGRTVSFREGSCEKCSTRWFKLTFWSPNVGCHFANVRLPFALIAGIEKKTQNQTVTRNQWLVLFELVTSLRIVIMVNSPFFYTTNLEEFLTKLSDSLVLGIPRKMVISPNILLVHTLRIQVCPKKGITPAFLFWIGILNPLLGKDLDP